MPAADAQRREGELSEECPTDLTLLCDIFMCKTFAVMASPPQPPLRVFFFLLLLRPLAAQIAHGPLPDGDVHHPRMGWVTDHAKSLAPSVVAGVLSVQGDTRVYLVQDYTKRDWEQHQVGAARGRAGGGFYTIHVRLRRIASRAHEGFKCRASNLTQRA